MKFIKELCFDPEIKVDKYKIRRAARAVVLNEENKIALMNVTKHNYYKLPGGGVEDSEDLQMALVREIKEEVGAQIETTGEVGMIIEYRNATKHRERGKDSPSPLCQISFCYTARVICYGQNNLDEFEQNDGFVLEWHPLDKAIELLKSSNPHGNEYVDYSGKYMVDRDLTFLKTYRASIKSQ